MHGLGVRNGSAVCSGERVSAAGERYGSPVCSVGRRSGRSGRSARRERRLDGENAEDTRTHTRPVGTHVHAQAIISPPWARRRRLSGR